MSITRTSAALALSVAIPALALATPVFAQSGPRAPMQTGATYSDAFPAAPTPPLGGAIMTPSAQGASTFTEERTVGPDGVETIIRTRVIRSGAPAIQTIHPQPGIAPYPVMPATAVFERDHWLAECDRRIDGRNEKERAQIIGGLLGAIGGGILGNVLADGNRLGGTLIGAGAGGLAGVGLGSLLGGGKRGDRYDCEAALDGYMAYYGQHGTVPTVAYPYPPVGYQYAYSGNYGYSAGCGCQQPQMVLVPIRTEVRQRVILREVAREILVPGERVIDPPKPIKPQPIKPSKPTKLIKQ